MEAFTGAVLEELCFICLPSTSVFACVKAYSYLCSLPNHCSLSPRYFGLLVMDMSNAILLLQGVYLRRIAQDVLKNTPFVNCVN